jgi:hypothetical protein
MPPMGLRLRARCRGNKRQQQTHFQRRGYLYAKSCHSAVMTGRDQNFKAFRFD